MRRYSKYIYLMKDLFPVYLKNSYNSVIRKQPYKMDR